jgi:hypothetical protein
MGGAGSRTSSVVASVALVLAALVASGCVSDLGTQLGAGGFVVAINDAGTMLGWTNEGPMRFEPDGTRVTLAKPAGATGALTHRLNNHGVAIGSASFVDPSFKLTQAPLVWGADGAVTDLRPWLEGGDRPRFVGAAEDINDEGLVVGWLMYPLDPTVSTSPSVQRLFAWDSRSRTAVAIPPDVAGDRPSVMAVNVHGVMVGRNAAGAARWTPEGGTYRYERLVGIQPHDINDDGVIVGLAGPGPGVPSVLPAGATQPVPLADPGWPASDYVPPAHVNNAGMIVFTLLDQVEGNAVRPVRWRTPSATPEQFPKTGLSRAEISDLNNRGVAVGFTVDAQGTKPVRWS